jgi:hypothetical protein
MMLARQLAQLIQMRHFSISAVLLKLRGHDASKDPLESRFWTIPATIAFVILVAGKGMIAPYIITGESAVAARVQFLTRVRTKEKLFQWPNDSAPVI